MITIVPRIVRTSVSCAALAAWVALAASVSVALAAPASAGEPDALVRGDLGFRLELSEASEAAGWSLLDAEEVTRVQPRAAAGMIASGGLYGVVVVEKAPGGELVDLARELLDATSLESPEVESFTEVQVDGRDAVRWQVRGRSGETSWRQRFLLVEAGGRLYRLAAWGPTDAVSVDGATLAPLFESFHLVENATTSVAPLAASTAPEARGVGWRVHRGVWQGPAWRLEIAPRERWRIVYGDELAGWDQDATVGLAHEATRARLVLTSERIAPAEQRQWKSVGWSGAELRGEPLHESLLVSLADEEVELRMYTARDSENVRMLRGLATRGDRALTITATYPISFEGDALAALHVAFDSLRWLTDESAAALARSFGPAPESEVIGDGFALRGGVYRDFRFGLTWRQPSDGWRLEVSEAADRRQAGAVLALSEPELGVRGYLLAEPVRQLPAWERHEEAVRRAMPTGGERLGEPVEATLGEVVGLVSVFDTGSADAARRRTVLATADNGGWSFQVRLWGSPGVLGTEDSSFDERALAALRSVSIEREIEPAQSLTGLAFYDDRLGFQLESPGEGWTFDDTGADRFWPSGTFASWTRGESDVLAAIALGGAGEEELDTAFWSTVVRSSLPVELVGAFDAEPRAVDTTFVGRPAVELTWIAGERVVTAWLVERGQTVFAIVKTESGRVLEGRRTERLFGLLH